MSECDSDDAMDVALAILTDPATSDAEVQRAAYLIEWAREHRLGHEVRARIRADAEKEARDVERRRKARAKAARSRRALIPGATLTTDWGDDDDDEPSGYDDLA